MILSFGGGPAIGLESDDVATLDWILEFYGPALEPAGSEPRQRIRVSASPEKHAELSECVPAGAPERPCFAFDQQLFTLPAAGKDSGVVFADAERACAFRVGPVSVELAGEPGNRRWRLIALLAFHELIATPLRLSELELHAAAVEHDGAGILICGPKGAGKTTLTLHLLRTGRCRQVANDRVFAGAGTIRGMPQAIKVLPETAAEFPELIRHGPWIDRAHLHTLAEVDRLGSSAIPDGATLMLSPAQLAQRMGAGTVAAAPVAAVLFPQAADGDDGPLLDPIDEGMVRDGLWANLYGGGPGSREPTIFEELAGGQGAAPADLVDRLAASVPGYRVVLGRAAREDAGFGERLLEELGR